VSSLAPQTRGTTFCSSGDFSSLIWNFGQTVPTGLEKLRKKAREESD
jgi:hypothetical protein